MTVSKEDIERIVASMREHQIPPAIVTTEAMAKELTEQDQFGRVWEVGDEYYVLVSDKSKIFRFFK